MSDKFQDKYRIPSARAAWWDYRDDAAYFVTICTSGREHFFGEIADGKMHLSEIGQIAKKNWLEIPTHFPFIRLDAFVTMPNHMHGILVIDHFFEVSNDDSVETLHATSLQQPPQLNDQSTKNEEMAAISPKKVHCHRLSVRINHRFLNRRAILMSILPGKPVSMITLSAMSRNIGKYGNIS